MSLIVALLMLLLFCAVVWVAYYVLGRMQLPEPMKRIATIVLGVIFLCVLLAMFLSWFGYGPNLFDVRVGRR